MKKRKKETESGVTFPVPSALEAAAARLIAVVGDPTHAGAAHPGSVLISWHDWITFVNAAKGEPVETETPIADPIDETAGDDSSVPDVPEDPTEEPEAPESV